VKFTIQLNPVTKKNHSQIISASGRPFLIPSKQYTQYFRDCRHFIKIPKKPIDYPVNVKATYYMQTRRKVDLANLHNALHDILKDYKVVEDDNSNIIAATDGSRVMYDKDNPRTEIEITELVR
jgi:Holliday junction resolvase RusA-like endonuclease